MKNKEEAKQEKQKSTFREYAEAICLAILLALFVRAFVVQAFKIPSGSMKPTLLVGDHILVNKFIYGVKIPFTQKYLVRLSDPKRFDVIVFIYPVDPSKDFIKRIIGLPGDEVQVVDKKVYINGELLNDPYAHFVDGDNTTGESAKGAFYGPVKVPADSYFVMGDNRDRSLDSRFWGFVSRDAIKGKAFIIYWSWTFDPFVLRLDRVGDLVH